MKLLHVFTLCFIVSVSYATESPTSVSPTPSISFPWPWKTTTKPSTTSAPSTTSVAPTTPSTTIPPTSAPTTPTPTPSPTTPTPTTPSPPTTPSSEAPTTPTTAIPPTPSTTPAPLPKEWVVRDPVTNHVCIIANMDITFNLHATNISREIKISPSTAKVANGTCNLNSSQTLDVVWPFGSGNSSMHVVFTEKDKNYFISGLELLLAYNSSGAIKVANFSNTNLTLFETTVNTSYSCASTEIPELKNGDKEHVDIKVTNLHYEAFRVGNTTSFSSSHFCDGEVPDVVPLVVGICLAVLVLVVVVAYLIGRRRSQASGYLSM